MAGFRSSGKSGLFAGGVHRPFADARHRHGPARGHAGVRGRSQSGPWARGPGALPRPDRRRAWPRLVSAGSTSRAGVRDGPDHRRARGALGPCRAGERNVVIACCVTVSLVGTGLGCCRSSARETIASWWQRCRTRPSPWWPEAAVRESTMSDVRRSSTTVITREARQRHVGSDPRSGRSVLRLAGFRPDGRRW